MQEQLAKVFQLSLNRVRVVVPPVGGGYGGKNHARIEPVVALLARKARRPVRWILTREEVFLTGRRFGAVVKIKTGFKRDGRLWARKAEVYYDMGAYALSGPANTKNACIIAGGPYNIPHRDYTAYAVYTNLPPAGPFRGVGASHVCWAYEPINATFLDYLLPSIHDHPVEFHSVLVETPHPDGPFGAKGMGEAACRRWRPPSATPSPTRSTARVCAICRSSRKKCWRQSKRKRHRDVSVPPRRPLCEARYSKLHGHACMINCRRYIGNIRIRISHLDYPFRIWRTILNSLRKLRIYLNNEVRDIQICILSS